MLRHGEQTFYTARYSFQGQIGCASCHIDSTFDGLTWDLEPDGFGRDIVDNRLIEDLKDTEPYKWNGGNPEHSHRVRTAHGEVLLALGAVRRSDADRSGDLHSQPAPAAQSLASCRATS